MLRIFRNAMLVAISGLAVLSSVMPAIVSAATMSTETRLSTIVGYSVSPQITSYGNNLYVVWAEGVAANIYDIYATHSTDNGDTWQRPVKIASAVNTPSPSPQIGGGKNGVYVFWTDNYYKNSSGTGIYFSRSTDNGGTFSAPALTIAKANNGYTRLSSVLVDPSGASDRLYLAWYDSRYANGSEIGQAMLAVSCDAGNTFSSVQQVSANDRGNDAESPRLALGTDGTLFMLYRSSLEGMPQEGWAPFSQHLIRSNAINCGSNPPVSWLQPSQAISAHLPEDNGNAYGALIASGANQRLHIGFWSEHNGNNLVYRSGLPSSSGWSDPVDLTSTISGYGQNHLEFDGAGPEYGLFGLGEDLVGNVHAAIWQGSGTVIDGFNVGKIFYVKGVPSAGNYGFGGLDSIVSSNIAMDPRAIVNSNRLAIIWADFRDNNNGAGGSEIYYRHVLIGKLISVSATSLDFGSQMIRTTSATQSFSISVVGDQTVTFTGVGTTGPFSASTNCGIQSAGSTCTVTVNFSPTVLGTANGTLTIYSDALNGPANVALTGTASPRSRYNLAPILLLILN